MPFAIRLLNLYHLSVVPGHDIGLFKEAILRHWPFLVTETFGSRKW